MKSKVTGTILLILSVLLFAQIVYAKPWQGKSDRGSACQGFQALELTEQQKELAKEIFQTKRAETKAVWNDENLTKEQKTALAKEIRQAGMNEFRQILTTTQQERLDEVIKNCAKRKPARGDAKSLIFRAAYQLNLSDEQKAAIKEIAMAHRGVFMAVKNDQSLTPEQKKAALNQLRLQVQPEIRAILTPEQQVKFDEMLEKGIRFANKRFK